MTIRYRPTGSKPACPLQRRERERKREAKIQYKSFFLPPLLLPLSFFFFSNFVRGRRRRRLAVGLTDDSHPLSSYSLFFFGGWVFLEPGSQAALPLGPFPSPPISAHGIAVRIPPPSLPSTRLFRFLLLPVPG